MFDVRISKSSLSKDFKFRVTFPNWQEVSGEPPTVKMIALSDKSILFDTNDILYAINDYENGLSGVNYNQVRKVITGYSGYGKVVIFRRGGIYADVQALKNILKRIFSDQIVEVPKYCTVAHPAALAAIMKCPPDKFADMNVTEKLRVPLSDMIAVVPSTIAVTKKEGVVGVPISVKPDQEDPEQPPVKADDVTETNPTDPSSCSYSAGTNGVEFSPIAHLTAMQELIRQLSAGKKLVIKLGLE